jgi:formate hydrogenlyase regulatory protein HycA
VLARARAHLATRLRGLPRRTYTDIAVRPFELVVDGVLFGLVTGEEDGEGWAELYPDRLGFGPPWDGSYDA